MRWIRCAVFLLFGGIALAYGGLRLSWLEVTIGASSLTAGVGSLTSHEALYLVAALLTGELLLVDACVAGERLSAYLLPGTVLILAIGAIWIAHAVTQWRRRRD